MDPRSTQQLHIFFLPFMLAGHTIPMVHLADLFSSRGVKTTILTTPINTSLGDGDSYNSTRRLHQVLHLPLTPSPDLPEDCPDLTSLTTHHLRPILKTADLLRDPVDRLLLHHHPDCLISDVLLPWSADLAARHGIPSLAFHTSGFFPLFCTRSAASRMPRDGFTDATATVAIPVLPHPKEIRVSQLPEYIRSPSEAQVIVGRFQESELRSYGVVVSGFHEMESPYAEHYKRATGVKAWHVLPMSLGGDGGAGDVLNWLDLKEPRSVVYLCFGSLGKLTGAQLREIASGLEASGRPFLWVARDGDVGDGFEERTRGKGLVVRGWAPQAVILNHPAIGGFVTHCGWNSTLEGVSAGVPMITWPLFAEQFINEVLMVDVLGVGIRAGAEVCSIREEARTVVRGEEVRRAVEGLMGGGEEAEGRRGRARELGEKARRAVEEGGSSYNDLTRLIDELNSVKTLRIGFGSGMIQI